MTQTVKQIKEAASKEVRQIKVRAKEDVEAVKKAALQQLASTEVKYAKKAEKEQVREENEKKPKRYSIGEEIFNSITHGIGAGLAVAALVLVVIRAIVYAPAGLTAFYVTGAAIYGATLFILYLMSTLYHALTPYGVKKIFSIFDHSCIYLLISGTYTPFCLGVLRTNGGWIIFGIIWGITILGITLYAVFGNRMRIASVVTYVIMGWLIVFVWKPLVAVLPSFSIKMLAAGGIAYTVGVIFYALKRIKWMHCIWHLFVMAGSIFHFLSVYFSIG